MKIFKLMVKQNGLHLAKGADSILTDRFCAAGKRVEQGNARFVRQIFEDVCGAQQVRLASEARKKGFDKFEFTPEQMELIELSDLEKVLGTVEEGEASAIEEIGAMVGLDNVKKVLTDQVNYAKVSRLCRDRGLKTEFWPMHMAFVGQPGTGKTEMARRLARAYKEAGFLSVGELFECGRQDLVAGFVGQTASKV